MNQLMRLLGAALRPHDRRRRVQRRRRRRSGGGGGWGDDGDDGGMHHRGRRGRGPGQHHRLGRLHRGRRRPIPAYDWVTQFESDTGCEVNVKTAGTSDEMVSLMQEGGGEFDLVTASGDASLRLIAGGTVQPVNIDLIESWDTVDERLQDAPWHTVDTDGDGDGRALRRAVPVGLERPAVQRRRCSGARRPRAGTSCSRRRRCPTARATPDACRRTTARSTSPTPRCT